MQVKKTTKKVAAAPSELWLMAKAYLDAANTCYSDCQRRDKEFADGNRNVQATCQVIPTVFLYFRAIELALKAAIRERNLATPDQIRYRCLGHNLKTLIERATDGTSAFTLAELGMDQHSKGFLERWSDDYGGKSFEYDFGPWDIPKPADCQKFATAIVDAIWSIAKTITMPDLP